MVLTILGGCVSTSDPNATLSAVRVYPMGPSQYMITCVDSPGYCACALSTASAALRIRFAVERMFELLEEARGAILGRLCCGEVI